MFMDGKDVRAHRTVARMMAFEAVPGGGMTKKTLDTLTVFFLHARKDIFMRALTRESLALM